MVYDCSPETTIAEFQEWVLDKIMWPPAAYYVTFKGRLLFTGNPEQTFTELNILQEDTLCLIGRMINKSK
jgi:hypothetical protein